MEPITAITQLLDRENGILMASSTVQQAYITNSFRLWLRPAFWNG